MLSHETWKKIKIWNRKLHFYVGLYMLLFLWLFAVSGLILNHTNWRFAQFWPDRKESTSEQSIAVPRDAGRLARTRDLMQQLNISGEIDWPDSQPEPGHLQFRLTRPGQFFDVKADMHNQRATVRRTQVNGWGILYNLHTFIGVRMNNPNMERDWLLTKIWSFSIDALVLSLLFMVLSSYYMWYGLTGKRRLGMIALALGMLSCGFFVVGLVWLDLK